MKTKYKIKIVSHCLFLFILNLLIVGTFYINLCFFNQSIDELFFYAANGAINGDLGVYMDAIKTCTPFMIPLQIILIMLFYNIFKKDIHINIKNKKIKIYPFEIFRNHKIIFTIILSIISLTIAAHNVSLLDYFINNINESSFIKDNYVNPKNKVTFNDKRNLVYIYVESLETTLFSKEHGGEWNEEIIPELYDLLNDEDAIYFSSNDNVGGMSELKGVTWTTAGVISTSTGVPLKVPVFNNIYDETNFMKGTYAIGEILEDNGYHNELISGALTSFGGIKDFYTLHGKYEIIDTDTLSKYNFKQKDNDYNPWGFNDNYLFNIAKKRLLKLKDSDKPFNLTLMTIDTHPTDGYIGNYSLDKFDKQYENVYATTSKLIGEFIDWMKTQDFYEDTTIVIIGDHLSVQYDIFKDIDYNKRNIYNVILNSQVDTNNTKNRIFTSQDMYPTTLAAMGAEIKDDKLGLGINLFSSKKTLSEEYGLKEMNRELEKKSTFYDKNILQNDK